MNPHINGYYSFKNKLVKTFNIDAMHKKVLVPYWVVILAQARKMRRNDTWALVGTEDERIDDVIKRKHFPRYWPFVWGIHQSLVNSPHKGQWRGALVFSLSCAWINGWINNVEGGDWRRHRAHYDVTVIYWFVRDFSEIEYEFSWWHFSNDILWGQEE